MHEAKYVSAYPEIPIHREDINAFEVEKYFSG